MTVRDIATLLRDGLRLSLLLAPRRTVLDAGVGAFALVSVVLLLVALSWHWLLFDPPYTLNPWGFQTFLAQAVLQVFAAGVLCAVCARRRMAWSTAALLQAALLLPNAAFAALAAATGAEHMQAIWAMLATLLWIAAIHLRLAWFLAGLQRWRAPIAAVLSLGVVLLPWVAMHSQYLWTTDWAALREQAMADAEDEPGLLADPEAAMYSLGERLDAATAALAPQRPGTVEMYVLAFGGDASERVFRNEIDFVERLFPQRFDTAGRVLALANQGDDPPLRPLATATNLERGLAAIGQRMDVAEDILFVYLTSHGSPEHELYVNQPPLALDQVTPQRLREALDASGIRWRVVVVSACFSGGFIEALRDPHTLVVTAASADRSSFGCGSESDITWFGHAFLAEALNETADLREAFERSIAVIAEREKEQDFEPSNPQWDAGEHIEAQLARWREGFTPGAAVPFAPFVPASDEDAPAPPDADRNRKAAATAKD